MDRLAAGKKTVVNKKEMKNLSKKNYQNLPEIKMKKDEERKRQEALEKKMKVREYQKQLQAQSRAKIQKKRVAGTSVNPQPN